MVYLVSNQLELFTSSNYKRMSVEDSIKVIESFNIIQFDTETSGLDCHINTLLCAQFGNDALDVRIVVDCTTVSIRLYKKVIESKCIIGQNLKFDIKFLFNYEIFPINCYDTMIVEQLLYLGYPKDVKKEGCVKFGLGEISLRRIGVDIDKSIRGDIIWRGLDESVIVYAANDVTWLEKIAYVQMADCRNKQCIAAAKLECDFVPVIAYMEWCGIRLDETKWKVKMTYDECIRDIFIKALNDFIIASASKRESYLTYITDYGKEDSDVDKERRSVLKYAIRREDLDIHTDFGANFEAYEGKPIELSESYITINRQGDLFTGFDIEPVCNVSWSSPKQVIDLAKTLGFDTVIQDKNTGDDKDTVIEKHLRRQKGICDPFLDMYFNYKEASKVCSTYGQSYINAINPKTQRIHTDFWQLGSKSGRMSCGSTHTNRDLAKLKGLPTKRQKNPKLHCGYPQLQNLPALEATRGAFVPNNGNIMCSSDYAALESRLGADIYEEAAMIEEYLNGSGDIHSLVAKGCFPEELKGISVKDIKKLRPDLRKKAKAPEFACQFGGGADAIQNALGCSREEAVVIEKNYYTLFQGIAKFKAEGSKLVRKNGYVLMCKLTGHKMYWWDHAQWCEEHRKFDSEFWDRYKYLKGTLSEEEFKELPIRKLVSKHFKASSKWDRMALNAPTQGSGIVILKYAITNFYVWIIKNGLFNKVLIDNLIHDEAVIEYPESMPDTYKVLQTCMEESSALFCKRLPIPASAECGDHWIH